MKTCSQCKIEKPLELFSKNKNHKDGLQALCKTCHSAYYKEWKLKNRNKVNEYMKQWYEAQKTNNTDYHKRRTEYLKTYNSNYYAEHKEYFREYTKLNNHQQNEYRLKNMGRYAAWAAKRRNAKLLRTPKWVDSEELWLIEEAYDLAATRSKMTGIQWHVDHIIPLQGKTVSGLHVPENLQVIRAEENLRKGNRYDQT